MLASTALSQASLAELEQRFSRDHDQLYANDQRPTSEQRRKLTARHTKELETFLEQDAKGEDRWNGRLLLADLYLMQRQPDQAKAALQGIDTAAADPVLLLFAADMATQMRQQPLRDKFIAAAIEHAAQPSTPLAERMEAGKILMTLLVEIDSGEKIFADALAQATDDEARAHVRWYHCEAIREREDLPENSYYMALEKLARDLPKTYYGSIAKDRGTASQFAIGTDAIPFTAKTTTGRELTLQSLRGKPVVLAFWSAADEGAQALVNKLEELKKQQPDLFVLGISMDDDPAAFQKACKALGASFPQICDGGGFAAELALRYHVETAPTLIVLDRLGRIAGLNLHIDTRDVRDQLEAALERAQRPIK